jgi:hypothetical protein
MPGTFLHDGVCDYCPAGRSSSSQGELTYCDVICPAGQYSGSAQLWCHDCPAGKFGNASEADRCHICPGGKYSNSSGQSFCYDCPSLMSSASGATSALQCQQCKSGYEVTVVNSSVVCRVCTSGKYEVNQTCIDCPKGKYSSDEAAELCFDCPYGKWSSKTALYDPAKCQACPTQGAKCDAGSAIPHIDAGWYRNVSQSEDVIMLCIPQEACLEGGYSSTPCAVGYEGIACSDCALGYFRLGDKCKLCLSAAVRWIIVVLLLFLAILIFWRLSLIESRIPWSVKILIQWIQFLGIYGTLSEKWPASLSTIFNITNVFNIDMQYFAFTCDKGITFWGLWMFKVLLPVIVFASCITMLFIKFRFKLKMTREEALKQIRPKIAGLFLVLTLFATVTFSTLFQVFNCVEQMDGVHVLKADPSVKCYTGNWNAFVAVDAIFLFFYTTLLPGWGIYIVIKNRSDRTKLEELIQPFVAPYREGCEYWEFVRLGQKIIFFLIRDLPVNDSTFKVVFLLAVLMTELLLVFHLMPFKSENINRHTFR